MVSVVSYAGSGMALHSKLDYPSFAPSGVAPRFFESVAVFHLVILGLKESVSMINQ